MHDVAEPAGKLEHEPFKVLRRQLLERQNLRPGSDQRRRRVRGPLQPHRNRIKVIARVVATIDRITARRRLVHEHSTAR